ncbi:RRXRR protein [Desulforamulus putei DSM 12395]|uniref:RRXRR protein n=2 Tax=Desulforamulus putei TaxID=74701 RepID=A0A1M4ZBL2_9FIRM|nr:RRXRR protein [Desulforamulus putei DSM 12395]
MPTERYGKARRMLRDGRAKVVKAKPFTIQLTYETTKYTQPITLGIDAGYQSIGFSAITEKKELLAGECQLLQGQVERNRERLMYRRQMEPGCGVNHNEIYGDDAKANIGRNRNVSGKC